MKVTIEKVAALPTSALDPLIAESEQDGWRFVRRLADELASGTNRFDRPGECLFAARDHVHVVGVCGLNVDPYAADPTVGRVRHVYVMKAYRGQGIGRQLVEAVVSAAGVKFDRLRVRTENSVAGRLYERLGFERVSDVPNCTHTLSVS